MKIKLEINEIEDRNNREKPTNPKVVLGDRSDL